MKIWNTQNHHALMTPQYSTIQLLTQPVNYKYRLPPQNTSSNDRLRRYMPVRRIHIGNHWGGWGKIALAQICVSRNNLKKNIHTGIYHYLHRSDTPSCVSSVNIFLLRVKYGQPDDTPKSQGWSVNKTKHVPCVIQSWKRHDIGSVSYLLISCRIYI